MTTNNVDNSKIRRAKQLGLVLVNIEYVNKCRCLLPGQTSVDINEFLIKSVEDQENVSSIRKDDSHPSSSTVTKIKLWNWDDVDLPRFDELTHCEIGKWAIFKEEQEINNVFFVLELQVIPEQYYDRTTSDYRLRFRYEKQTTTDRKLQYAFSNDSNEQQQLFASYYYQIIAMPHVIQIHQILPNQLGSKLLLRVSQENMDKTRNLYV